MKVKHPVCRLVQVSPWILSIGILTVLLFAQPVLFDSSAFARSVDASPQLTGDQLIAFGDVEIVIESSEIGSDRSSVVAVLQAPDAPKESTIVWTPFPDEGQGEPRAKFSWASGGEKSIHVTVVSADDSRITQSITVAVPPIADAGAEEVDAADGQSVDIIGGREAAVGAWPWQVALMADPENANTQFCGGALIGSGWVMTAAHCVDTWNVGTLYTVAGRHRLSAGGGETLPVAEIIIHPSWNRNTAHSDIALLKLATSSSATPLSIDAPSYSPGTEATVIGWGLTIPDVNSSASDVLMQVQTPVIDNQQCIDVHGSSITSSMICAGQARSDVCHGDSGGPLMIPGSSTDWAQIGIVSWGRGCGDSGYPAVFTNVAVFKDWIRYYLDGGVTPAETAPIYRFYCQWGDHFFTINDTEKNSIGSYCDYEGVGWNAFAGPRPGTVPVYRLFCSDAADHFYTTNEIERQVIAPRCSDEGIAFYTYPDQQPGTVPVYRLYCWWGDHFFTTNPQERDVIADICQYEGIGWYAFPASGGTPPVANINNGDFEQGATAWGEVSAQGKPLILDRSYLPIDPHSGNWSVWLGGLDYEVSYISQVVTVPSGQPYLNYWHWIGSQDACGYDYGGVGVNGEWYYPYELCQSTNTGGWVPVSVDMSPFAGATIELDIVTVTDLFGEQQPLHR